MLSLWHAVLFTRARGIKFRQNSNEAVGGLFSQIGDMYNVHHFWGKSNMNEHKYTLHADMLWHIPMKHPMYISCTQVPWNKLLKCMWDTYKH